MQEIADCVMRIFSVANSPTCSFRAVQFKLNRKHFGGWLAATVIKPRGFAVIPDRDCAVRSRGGGVVSVHSHSASGTHIAGIVVCQLAAGGTLATLEHER